MIVDYRPRKATKTATYWDMDPSDNNWIKEQLRNVLIEAAERSLSADQLDINYHGLVNEPNEHWGRSVKYKKENSIASLIGGILKNFNTGTRDLTDRNCENIREIFDILHQAQQQGLIPKDIAVPSITWRASTTDVATTTFDQLFNRA